jgi:hypothetical protein
MPRYRVLLSQRVYASAEVEVTAENEDEACDKVCAIENETDITWDYSDRDELDVLDVLELPA